MGQLLAMDKVGQTRLLPENPNGSICSYAFLDSFAATLEDSNGAGKDGSKTVLGTVTLSSYFALGVGVAEWL
jgi:hypothetical protein